MERPTLVGVRLRPEKKSCPKFIGNSFLQLILSLAVVLFFGPGCGKRHEASYYFALKDSLIVEGWMDGLIPLDVNSKGDILFASDNSDTIFMTDPKGRVYSKIAPIGNEIGKIGDGVYNVGIFEDSLILASGSRGYFFYDRFGALKRVISSVNKEGLTYTKRIKWVVNQSGDTILASEFRTNFSYERLAQDTIPDKDFQKEKRFVTCYNLRNSSYKLAIGYEKGTIFEKADYIKKLIFDVSTEDTTLYFVTSPERVINIYEFMNDTLSLRERIGFETDHFKTDIDFAFGREREKLHDAVFINSMINDINVNKDFVAITYSTGVPSEGWFNTNFDNNEERAEYIKKMKEFYLVLLRKSDKAKLSADIKLPDKTSGICLFRDLNHILMQPDFDKQGYSTTNKFYIYGLKKKEGNYE